MIVFWNQSKGPIARRGTDVGLDFTDQPAPAPDTPPQPPAVGEEVDHPGYEDPHGDMPVDDEDMPPPQAQQPEPDLDDDPIELTLVVIPPSQPPGSGAQVPQCKYAKESRAAKLEEFKMTPSGSQTAVSLLAMLIFSPDVGSLP